MVYLSCPGLDNGRYRIVSDPPAPPMVGKGLSDWHLNRKQTNSSPTGEPVSPTN